jgi:hypothetical protein
VTAVSDGNNRYKVPTGALVADITVAALIGLGLLIVFFGPAETYVAGARWSISRPSRAFVLAMIIAAIRHWRVPRHPWFSRLIVRESNTATEVDPGQGRPKQPLWSLAGEAAIVTAGLAAFVVVLTWPQAAMPHSVPDKGDPLFSTWRLAWIAHQIVRDPLRLFDGNIFYPERLTLTYSDPVIVEGLVGAPFLWLGAHQLTVYTLLLLSGFVLSGVTMYFLVRRLTGRRDAAVVGGVIFAACPYRFEHYSHLELQMAMWMPLALLGLHRTMATGRVRDGVLTGTAVAGQALSSLYYGCYLAVYLVPVTLVLWLARGRPLAPLRALTAGALVAVLLAAPVALQYARNKSMLGERPDYAVAEYSARPGDFFEPHPRSRMYEAWSADGKPERQIFPGFAPMVLSAVALWPPLSVVRLAYASGLAIAVDGALGFNGIHFRWLRDWIPPFRGLRVPARFAIIVSMTLAILASIGAAAIFRRWPNQRAALAACILAIVAIEPMPRLQLEPVWSSPPDIYRKLSKRSPSVLAELPVGTNEWGVHFDATYIYFSTFHWQRLVNGNSGFFPPSYEEFMERVRYFPSDRSIEYLRSRGVEYFAFHGEFTNGRQYRRAVRDLQGRPDIELVASAPWANSESRLYRLRPVPSTLITQPPEQNRK